VDIIATNDEYFDKLEKSVSIELSKIGPALIKERLEEIDKLLFDRRPYWLIPIRFDKRRILTLSGYVEFKRRYYFDTREKIYTHLLDSIVGVPRRGKLSASFRLKLARMASEMTYSKATRWAPFWEEGTVSRSTVCRSLKALSIVTESSPIRLGNGTIHVQVDEKYAKIIGRRNKSRIYTATIFTGKKNGKLVGRTLLRAFSSISIYKAIDETLRERYGASVDDNIYLSGDLAPYIRHGGESILSCRARYVPDKWHVKESLMKELGLLVSDKEMARGKFIRTISEALKGSTSEDGKKLSRLIKEDPSCFSYWRDKRYLGCCQEGMNSHYYAPRLAKLPGAGFSRENASKILLLTLAEANGEKIRLGIKQQYDWIPDIGGNPLGDYTRQRYDIDASQYPRWIRDTILKIEYGGDEGI
jgi:hypothetical protein